jgi:phospholipid-translocating ATPase
MNFPPLYKTIQKGRDLNFKTFALWVWMSFYQGSVIIMFSVRFFNDSYSNIVTITFSSLVAIELLNVYTQINKYTFKMMLMQIATGVTYFLSVIMLQEYFDASYIDLIFLAKVGVVTLVTWLPLHMLQWIMSVVDPSEHKKIQDAEDELEKGIF